MFLHTHEKYIYSILATENRKERKPEVTLHPPCTPMDKPCKMYTPGYKFTWTTECGGWLT